MAQPLTLGIDLGGTDCKFGIVDPAGRVLAHAKAPTGADAGPDAVIDGIARNAADLLAKYPAVAAIGMGVPGPMSSRLGVVFEAPNLPGWNDTPVQAMMEERLKLPVTLHNDANAAAYGEFWAGAGRDPEIRTLVLFTLGTGVGGGIVIDGELYLGPDETAAELGHMIINFDDPERAGFAYKGCVEDYASAKGVRRMALEAVRVHGAAAGIDIPEGAEDDFGAKVVHDAALAGSKAAEDILRRVGVALGTAAANVINMLNPHMVCYSGGLIHAGEYIFAPLRETAKANSFAVPFARAKIAVSTLGTDAGIIGAAGLAMKKAGL